MQVVVWVDFDCDGYIDFFVGNELMLQRVYFLEFYCNNGDGIFMEIVRCFGVMIDGFVKGVIWGDVDCDGFFDFYVLVMGVEN